jgi:WD40 repeat protein
MQGFINQIAINPDYSGIMACSSISNQIGLYDTRTLDSYYILHEKPTTGSSTGISHMKFSTCGNYLLSRSRKSKEILVWDIRGTGQVTTRIPVSSQTQQRLYMDTQDDLLVAGDESGQVYLWDFKKNERVGEWNDFGVCSSVLFKSASEFMGTFGTNEFTDFEGGGRKSRNRWMEFSTDGSCRDLIAN